LKGLERSRLSDRALIAAAAADAILAAICCAAPLLAAALPLAGFAAWIAGAGLMVVPLAIAGLGLLAWALHIVGQKQRAARRRLTRKA
jgi:mercuric ion transport protein